MSKQRSAAGFSVELKKIAVIGEILVEIMADTVGNGFLTPISLTGPYPSGAPAIFIDQVARMGQPCAIISTVGDDDFGRVNVARLTIDGVDVSGITIDKERPTGSAFVRYQANGRRDFIFNIHHSACGKVHLNSAAEKILVSADHLHIMGSSLTSDEFISLNLKAAIGVKKRAGTISFDPNIRKELLGNTKISEAVEEILSLTDLYLPSGDEIYNSTSAKNELAAVSTLLGKGIGAIVHKLGAQGARYYDVDCSHFVPGFAVEEVDPTGAGDCFGGTFTALWLRKVEPKTALRLAAAAGAIAVTKRGPMEGASHQKLLEQFVAAQMEPIL